MAKAEGPPSAAPKSRTELRPLLVAVPFYKNEHLVAEVVGSLIRCAADLKALGAEVVLYDDSPDYAPLSVALAGILPQAAAAFPCRIERNSANLGFIRTMNKAIEEAVARRFDVVLLNSDTVVEPGALIEMARVSRLDPMIGFVNPRSNNASIATLPVTDRLSDGVASLDIYRALAAMLPDFTYVPTAIGFCLLIRWNIIAAFGGLDEIYGAGYNEENDLVMRASRCGYRAVQANHAFVWHLGEQSFGTADVSRDDWEPHNRSILLQRYPEYAGYTAAHYTAPETVAERLLAELIPDRAGRLDFAFDFSSFGSYYNGTFLTGRQLLAVARDVLGDLFDIYVLCPRATFEFLGFAEFDAQRRDPDGPEKYAVVFRIGQPYKWDEVRRMATKAAVVGIYMLDTISIDCPQLTSPQLVNLWQFALEQSDMIAALSEMTLGQLQKRFHVPRTATVATVLLSLEIEDYRIAGADSAQPCDGTILVLGNHYHHKDVAPTGNALAQAFPDRAIIALGVPNPEEAPGVNDTTHLNSSRSPNLTGIEVGGLKESDLGGHYAAADAVVFPTHYEGFGMPLLNALAARRPIFLRNLPVFEELWRGLGRNPNVHFYETTGELIEQLRDIPHWIAAPDVVGKGAAVALRKVRQALDTARSAVTYRRIVDRLRAVQFVDDAGGSNLASKAASRHTPRIDKLLDLDGAAFVQEAYLAVLCRGPDPDGLAHYIKQLEGKGRAEKIAILHEMVESEEGGKLGAHLPGLKAYAVYYRLQRRYRSGVVLVVGGENPQAQLVSTPNVVAGAFPDRAIPVLGNYPPENRSEWEPLAEQTPGLAPNAGGIAICDLDEHNLAVFCADADAVVFPMPCEDAIAQCALTARRPIIVRAVTNAGEFWRGLEHNPNVHFYKTSGELIERLRDLPGWIEAAEAGNAAQNKREMDYAGGGGDSMGQDRDFNEIIADLTWPLRGRRVTMRVEKEIRDDLQMVSREIQRVERAVLGAESERVRADDALKSDIEALRSDVFAIRRNMGTFTRQLDALRQMLARSLGQPENIARENVALDPDKIGSKQGSVTAPANSGAPQSGDEWQDQTSQGERGALA